MLYKAFIDQFCLNPFIHFLLLTLLSLLFFGLGKRRWGKGFTMAIVVWLLVVVISPLTDRLIKQKEWQYPPFQAQERIDSLYYPILVLGAGKTSDPSVAATTQLNTNLSKRLMEGLRIYQGLDSSFIIGSAAKFDSKIAQGETVAQAAAELGVAPKDTASIIRGTNTYTEAQDYTARFGTQDSLILVTSAVHMPRAVAIFASFGVKVIPAPTDYMSLVDPADPPASWRWDWGRVNRLGRWLHEAVGMWYFEVVQR